MRIPVVDGLVERWPRIGLVLGVIAIWAAVSSACVAAGWHTAHLWLAPLGFVALVLLLLANSE